MIPFFVGYAMLTWFGCAKHRRTTLGWGCVLIGVGGLATISYGHWIFGRVFPELMPQGLQILMYPYSVVVGAVAVFIASMPRPAPEGACSKCHYNLAGLGYPVSKCPECGSKADVTRTKHRPSGSPREDLRAGDPGELQPVLASQRPGHRPDHENQPGHNAQERPSDAGQLSGRERLDGGDRSGIGARSNQFILARQPRD